MTTTAIAAARHLRCGALRVPCPQLVKTFSTEVVPATATAATPAVRRFPPPPPHDFSKPNEFLGSWKVPRDPRVARARLERLRRSYDWQVNQMRKEYAYDVEMLRAEKQRKDDARREAARVANEERKALKSAAAVSRAAERQAFDEEFRKILVEERAEKLEYWRLKEKQREDMKTYKRDRLRERSSMWIDEKELETKIVASFTETTSL